MFKFFFLLILIGVVVSYLLRKRNIRIGLSPSGRDTLWRAVQRFSQWLLRRLGL
ncbi:MAG: hypothetical protein HQL98_16080 [Magnetococcales bacterium]|nr:hypothetical protein [Magnetococcales bacterium]